MDIIKILEMIKEENMVSRKDIASRFSKENRYIQGYLDALEDLDIIRVFKKGVNKFHELTSKGEDLYRELLERELILGKKC